MASTLTSVVSLLRIEGLAICPSKEIKTDSFRSLPQFSALATATSRPRGLASTNRRRDDGGVAGRAKRNRHVPPSSVGSFQALFTALFLPRRILTGTVSRMIFIRNTWTLTNRGCSCVDGEYRTETYRDSCIFPRNLQSCDAIFVIVGQTRDTIYLSNTYRMSFAGNKKKKTNPHPYFHGR